MAVLILTTKSNSSYELDREKGPYDLSCALPFYLSRLVGPMTSTSLPRVPDSVVALLAPSISGHISRLFSHEYLQIGPIAVDAYWSVVNIPSSGLRIVRNALDCHCDKKIRHLRMQSYVVPNDAEM